MDNFDRGEFDRREEDNRTGLEIAVIGMSGRFPGAGNIDEFWENLKNGVESISFLSDEELKDNKVNPRSLENPNYVRAKGGVLENKDFFDASFFDYSPTEAELMDPQFRIFHECAWHALENAGYDPFSYNGLIGVYAGASSNLYWQILTMLSGKVDALGDFASGQLMDKDYLSVRISHRLNLNGPALVIQSACSTSLVAIHTACQALLNAECHIALAGGVSISSEPSRGYVYQEGMIGSPDGHCRAFDSKAKGTISGNGAGMVALKLLEDAINDGDTIHAVVPGSALNNDGNRKSGFSAPAREGQTEVIKTAQMVAEIEPESITYIEAHGTGTTLGDPIEIEALTRAFNTEKRNYCAVGSVKTNIGHLDAAAGVTGFIKTVLALENRKIPPSLNFKSPNPMIDFEHSPFYVNTALTEWKNDNRPLRAGVSSFGIGGTNAHVILEEWPGAGERETVDEREYKLILLSARSEIALENATRNMANFLKENPNVNVADAAYTLKVGRGAFEYRKMLVCADTAEAVEALTAPGSEKVKNYFAKPGKQSTVFMFSGQGSQYVGMTRDIYRTEPVFREEMDRCFEILKPLTGCDIKDILYPPPGGDNSSNETNKPNKTHSETINRTEFTQPLLFAVEYSLGKLLIKWGITPDAMIGHSIGEYVAACLSGVFSLEDALAFVTLRGKLMQSMPSGSMLSVPLPEAEVAPLLSEETSLAAINSPSTCVVSGPHQAIDALENQLKEKGHDCKRLHTSHAFHSKMMDPILGEFEEKVKQVSLKRPEIPYISNVTGNWITAGQAVDPAYWSGHLRNTVRFSRGIHTLLEEEALKEGTAVFLEVGPGNVLSNIVRKHKGKKPGPNVINPVRHPKETESDDYYLLNKLGMLWLYGWNPDWSEFYAEEKRHRIPLPTYPFDRRRFRIDQDPFEKLAQMQAELQLSKKPDITDWFYIPSWERSILPGVKTGEETGPSCWLLFLDDHGVGARLKKQLEQEGKTVLTVTKGPVFLQEGNNRFSLDTSTAGDYETLVNRLKAQNNIPGGIVHLWSVTGKSSEESMPDIEAGRHAQETGFYSIIYLVQALTKQTTQNIRIGLVADNVHDVFGREADAQSPGKASVLGAVKVIPQEFPQIKTCFIDIQLPEPGSPGEEKLSQWLRREFYSEDAGSVIAYRDNLRMEQVFVPVKLEENRVPDTPLREQGVYLITGGLGGVGLVLAEYLAKKVKARLILTGRSPFPPREQWDQWTANFPPDDPTAIKIRKIWKIEETGARVLIQTADVSELEPMRTAAAEAEEQFGPINGIIHAAGLVGEQSMMPIAKTSPENCLPQFKPKIDGLLVLEHIFGKKDLDFCMLTSSTASVLGGLGFSAYAAANIYMDVFVQLHNKRNPGFWLSVNWDGWRLSNSANQAGMGITPSEGQTAFQRLLSCEGSHQVVVSTGDLSLRINRWIKLQTPGETEDTTENETVSSHPRPDLTSTYVAPQTEMESTMAGVWQNMFSIDKVGIHDDFFEMGGDSLQAIHLVRKLNAAGIAATVDKLFMFPTINTLYRNMTREQVPGENEETGKTTTGTETAQSTPREEIEYKDQVSEKEKQDIRGELRKNESLNPVTAKGKPVRIYDVSPLQRIYLAAVESTPKNILMFSYDFTAPLGISEIKKVVINIINKNHLFRSVIKKDNHHYFIHEFGPISDIELPLIDVSPYKPDCRMEIHNLVEGEMYKPFQLTDIHLYRITVVKTGPHRHSLFLVLNHMIFDGESMLILKRQIENMTNGNESAIEIEIEKEKNDYYTYSSFLKDRTYEDIGLESHMDIKAYIGSMKKTRKTGVKKYAEVELFKTDISMLSPNCKDFYNEIMLLAYAKLMHQFFGINKVPVSFYSYGRNYKDANFRNIIGAFHDNIPVLISFNSLPFNKKPNFKNMLESFLEYRKFIRSSNLNFSNFVSQSYEKGKDYSKILSSPFIFNPQVGLYDRYNDQYKNSLNEPQTRQLEFPFLRLDINMTKDLTSDNLLIRILQNSHFEIEELKKGLMENFVELGNYFNAAGAISI